MEKTLKNSVQIIEFSDYRVFAKAVFDLLRQTQPKVSLQWLANKIGVSKTFVKLLLTKQRHLALEKLPSLATALKLSREETHYFTFLACKNQTENTPVADFFESMLATLRVHLRHQPDVPVLEGIDVDEFFYKPLSMIIHSMATCENFEPNVNWIKANLANDYFRSEEISSTVANLLEKQFIVRQGNKWDQRDYVFATPRGGSVDAYKLFRNTLSEVHPWLKTPEKFKPNRFYFMTVSCNDVQMQDVLEKFMALRDSLIKISNERENPTNVLFVSNSLLRVAQQKE